MDIDIKNSAIEELLHFGYGEQSEAIAIAWVNSGAYTFIDLFAYACIWTEKNKPEEEG